MDTKHLQCDGLEVKYPQLELGMVNTYPQLSTLMAINLYVD